MIRYLLLILFIVLVIFATRALRKPGQGGTRTSGQPPGRSDDNDKSMMLACAHCGLHMPRNEVLPGKAGVYCSEAHRAAAEAGDGSA